MLHVTAKPRFRWDVLLTDGVSVTTLSEVPQLLGMAPFTGITVGADRSGPVDWDLYLRHGSFPYSGALHHVRIHPGPLSPEHRPSGLESGPKERRSMTEPLLSTRAAATAAAEEPGVRRPIRARRDRAGGGPPGAFPGHRRTPGGR